MTLVKDAANQIIAQFGEKVTVHPQSNDEPEDVNNPVFFEQSDFEGPTFDIKARIYTNPDDDTLKSYGFESQTEQVIYETDGNIDIGDEIEIAGEQFVVDEIASNQIGEGRYIFVYSLVGL